MDRSVLKPQTKKNGGPWLLGSYSNRLKKFNPINFQQRIQTMFNFAGKYGSMVHILLEYTVDWLAPAMYKDVWESTLDWQILHYLFGWLHLHSFQKNIWDICWGHKYIYRHEFYSIHPLESSRATYVPLSRIGQADLAADPIAAGTNLSSKGEGHAGAEEGEGWNVPSWAVRCTDHFYDELFKSILHGPTGKQTKLRPLIVLEGYFTCCMSHKQKITLRRKSPSTLG